MGLPYDPDLPAEADLLAQHLINLGLCVSPENAPIPPGSFPIYYGNMPDKPDNGVVTKNVGAMIHDRGMRGDAGQHARVQILVRTPKHRDGFQLARNVEQAVRQIGIPDVSDDPSSVSWFRPFVTLGGVDYVLVSGNVIVAATHIGQDESRRDVFSVNVSLSVGVLEL